MQTTQYNGFLIPKSGMGESLKTPQDYIKSGVSQVDFLLDRNLLDSKTKLLDFGCGVGRILTALKYENIQFQKYVGIDTKENFIDFCNEILKL